MFDSSGGGGQEFPSPDPCLDGFYPEVRCFYSPPRTSCRAMKSAVEPVEQLLLTLMMGMPVRPKLWYMALCPHVESPGGRNDSILENESLEAFVSFSLKVVSCSGQALTIDVPHTGLFNGRIWDACICQSLFTCNTVADGEHTLFRVTIAVKMAAC